MDALPLVLHKSGRGVANITERFPIVGMKPLG